MYRFCVYLKSHLDIIAYRDASYDIKLVINQTNQTRIRNSMHCTMHCSRVPTYSC